MSHYNLSSPEKQLFEILFFDKNKNILRFLAAKMQSLTNYAKYRLKHTNLKRCHEFLRDYADIVTNSIYTANDYTYLNLCGLIKKKPQR